MKIVKAINSLKKGKFLIICDSPNREKEADLVIHASFCTPKVIKTLRNEAGGMICLVINKDIAKKLGLDFFNKKLLELKGVYRKLTVKKTPYGDSPAFSIYINSKKCYTGISDEDRAKTIKEFEKMVSKNKDKKKLKAEFVKNFYSPGHIPLLIAENLNKRKGHSEYSIELAKRAGLSPVMVISEMLGEDYKAMEFKKAKEYAKKKRLVVMESMDFEELDQRKGRK
ncbi:MAG: 3,4-dihydroxy-2-butanone-4-phosphate synthase [Candidatus Anstonellaceae archaeon]